MKSSAVIPFDICKVGFLAVFFVVSASAEAGIQLRLEYPEYRVAPGDTFQVAVVIDGDVSLAGDQPVARGLFSYGIKLEFPVGLVEADGGAIDVVSALDYDGFAAGAANSVESSALVSQGNIVLTSGDTHAYSGTRLLTVTLKNLAPAGAVYTLQLASARRTQNQTLFVDGEGAALDDQTAFSSSTVRVRAAPSPIDLDIERTAAGVALHYTPLQGWDHYVEGSSDLKAWALVTQAPQNSGYFSTALAVRSRYFRLRIE